MASRVTVLLASFALLLVTINLSLDRNVLAETIKLTAILPKLEKIHEDTKTLLIRNAELKNKIEAGLKVQNATKPKVDGESKVETKLNVTDVKQKINSTSTTAKPIVSKPTLTPHKETCNKTIDYEELSEFNGWVDTNLEYAVKNTKASIEAFKDDAQQTNGYVEYSDQAIKDGEEGVKYWQSAVIFQEKTLNHEQFVVE